MDECRTYTNIFISQDNIEKGEIGKWVSNSNYHEVLDDIFFLF